MRYADGSVSSFSLSSTGVTYTASCAQQEVALPLKDTTVFKGKAAVLLNGNSASEMFGQNIRAGGNSVLFGKPTYGVSNTTFSSDLPAERNVSVTAGRVLLNGKDADKPVKPEVNVADLARLAAGQDVGIEAAFNQLKSAQTSARKTAAWGRRKSALLSGGFSPHTSFGELL
ncbi:S41 family peptidase [Deinococcus hopiensis]|uniref:S41 family peptidase n=1 Tax=Deinococcus hopiensis TaxID=309885 RepID=UPI000A0553D5|nr:S41 family peptidase [Deinococcus hopiensis]